MEKLVWLDNGYTKVYKGKTVDEDEFFIVFESEGKKLRVSKKHIVSLEEVDSHDNKR